MAHRNLTFGLTCTPSLIMNTKEIKATKILISFGGGMGGASQKLYAIKSTKKGDYLKVELIDGTTREINPRFIVYKKPVKLLRINIRFS